MKIAVCLLALFVASFTEADFLDNLQDGISNLEDKFQQGFSNLQDKLQQQFGDLPSKFHNELAKLQNISQQIVQGKNPVDIVTQLAQQGATKALTAVCATPLTHVDFVAQACKAITAGQRRRRNIFSQVQAQFQQAFGNIPQEFQQGVDQLKQVASSILQGKNPVDAITQIVQKGAQDALNAACNLPLVQHVDIVAQTCQHVNNVAPAPAAAAARHRRSLLADIQAKFADLQTQFQQNFGDVKAKFQQALSDLPAKFNPAITQLQGIATAIAQGQNPVPLITQAVQTDATALLSDACKLPYVQHVDVIAKVCQQVTSTAQAVQSRRRRSLLDNIQSKFADLQAQFQQNFGDVKAKFQQAFSDVPAKFHGALTQLQGIATAIAQGQNPVQLITQAVQTDATALLSDACKLPYVQHVDVIAKVCQQVTSSPQAVQARRRRSIFSDLQAQFQQNFADVKSKFQQAFSDLPSKFHGAITQLQGIATAIAQGQNPVPLITQAVQADAQQVLSDACKLPYVQHVDVIAKVCAQIAAPAQPAIAQRKHHGHHHGSKHPKPVYEDPDIDLPIFEPFPIDDTLANQTIIDDQAASNQTVVATPIVAANQTAA